MLYSGGERQMDENSAEKKKQPGKRKKTVIFTIVLLLSVLAGWSGRRIFFSPKTKEDPASLSSPVSASKQDRMPPDQPLSKDSRELGWPGSISGDSLGSGGHQAERDSQLPLPDQSGKNVLPGKSPAESKESDLVTESATASPSGTFLEPRDAGRQPVLPPSAGSGHLSSRENIIPPAFLDVGETVSPVKEDRLVLPAFIGDLARLMVQSYYPSPRQGGIGGSTLTLQKLDARYGHGLYGFNVSKSDTQAGRRSVLAYVMNPSMIQGLYHLYVDAFISDLDEESASFVREIKGKRRHLTPAERAGMFTLYSRDMNALARVLTVSCRPETEEMVAAYQKAEKQAVQAGSAYAEAVAARESKNLEGGSLQAASAQTEAAGLRYQNASKSRNKARHALITYARQTGNIRNLDDEEVMYALLWGQRRLNAHPAAKESLHSISQILENLSRRFDAVSAKLHE